MKPELLFLVFVVCPVLTIHIDAGCEVKSEWKIDYLWSDIDFSIWIPAGNLSNKMIIEIEFEDQIHPAVYDKIAIYDKRIELQQIRDGEAISVWNDTVFLKEGSWADFVLTVGPHYGLIYLDNSTLSLNLSIDYIPTALTLKGSNITLHCNSNLRTWKVSENLVSIPLDNSEQHWLGFYSIKEFSPILYLEMREVRVGWDHGVLTTIPSKSQPLPPYEQHHLMISCTKHSKIECTAKIGENRTKAEIMTFGDIPKSISVQGRHGDAFFVFLHRDDPISPQSKDDSRRLGTTENISAISITTFVATTVVLSIVILLLGGIIMYLLITAKRANNSSQKDSKKKEVPELGDLKETGQKPEPMKPEICSRKDPPRAETRHITEQEAYPTKEPPTICTNKLSDPMKTKSCPHEESQSLQTYQENKSRNAESYQHDGSRRTSSGQFAEESRLGEEPPTSNKRGSKKTLPRKRSNSFRRPSLTLSSCIEVEELERWPMLESEET